MAAAVRINLLPHREQKRQARQRQFVSFAILLAILALSVVGLVHMIFAAKVEDQNARNKLLTTEIAKLDEQIREIDKLRDQVPLYMRRLKVKPGLTGWAQVTLGYDNSIEDVKKKVMADLWSFENMSLGLDIQILVRTIYVVLTGKGAN